MKSSKIVDIFKDGNIVIPMYILKNYKKFKLELNEFIFLMYLYNKGNQIIFDPATFGKDLNINLEEVMNNVSNLSDKNLIKVEVVKNEKGLMEEVVKLDDFYSKMTLLVVDNSNNNDTSKSNIFETIEKEFGRTLSPIEYEIIKAWLDNNIGEDLIKEALKEATFNGVSNLRYIDKILYEWGKKGFVTSEDVKNNKKKRNTSKEMHEDKNVDLEIMDWDWFDDED